MRRFVLLVVLLVTAAPASALQLRDPSRQLQIYCGFDGVASAPQVCRAGRVIGVYLDDTTPRLPYWIGVARSRYSYVLVARAPSQRGCPWTGVICLDEFYAYNCRHVWRRVPRPPRAEGLIVQSSFACLLRLTSR